MRTDWTPELAIARAFCEARGLELVPVKADYQVAKIEGEGVRLVIYPHKTKGTGNRHLRVRSEGSTQRRRAQALMALLNRAAGLNCTFSFHGTPANTLALEWSIALLNPAKVAEVEAAADA